MTPLVEGKYEIPVLVAEAEKIVRKRKSGSKLGVLLLSATTTSVDDNNHNSNSQPRDAVDGLESIPKFEESGKQWPRRVGE